MIRLWRFVRALWAPWTVNVSKDSQYACVVWGKTLRKVM
jgi:hypothetical protein